MQRNTAENTITFSTDDLVLFRQSPFASWMERLTLENPRHGIPPDAGSVAPLSVTRPQNAFAATLRASGRRFVQIDWEPGAHQRSAATLEAMRRGIDFIVDGQLTVGPLSDSVNLLMRTSGFSELGDYLYLPCDTTGKHGADAGFRLCFAADLLHSLQGQLPPQLIEIRRGEELNALEAERHIYYYRAVKQRFMLAQRNFRKHRMPDPSESASCGRWYTCANEVLRQRLHQRREPGESRADQQFAEAVADTQVAIAAAAPERRVAAGQGGTTVETTGGTLAEQARTLAGQTVASRDTGTSAPAPRLEPLAFIAESPRPPELMRDRSGGDTVEREVTRRARPAPGPGLETGDHEAEVAQQPLASLVDADTPLPHPLDTPGFNVTAYRRPARTAPPHQAFSAILRTGDDEEAGADSESELR
ncbi:hypothetical protein [Parahaliea aestuarii]|uniref:Uncharacterized protein n=1 Tax=Parahaliea aestuarii TaxID=1852021 RepID=A0A5C8ZZT4_9GAMM|nr:hypothetical protein [Parahaliea aestuarii]TXS93309.1 hypothetical protein FVW59_05575 [Parahaliea aestuarii]